MTMALRGINLAIFIVYSLLLIIPLSDAALILMWLGSVVSTGLLARDLNRSASGWIIAAIVIPYWAAAFLALSARRPANALTAVDNSWLNMDRPTNRMVVCGILFFDTPLKKAALEQTIRNKLLKFDRFNQRVVNRNGFNCWEDDPDFRPEDHLRFHDLPAGAAMRDFHQEVNQLSEQPLDRGKPLWKMDVFQGLDGGSALVIRIHHCIADGIALVRVLLSMTSSEQAAPEAPPKARPSDKDSPFKLMLHTLAGLLAAFPHALKLPDSHSRLKNPLTGKRKTAWSRPMDLERVRTLSKAHNAKINDLVLAATAGALRDYLKTHGSNPDDMTLRVLVPVNLKPLDGEIVLGNRVGFVYVPLPINEDSPERRLNSVKSTMDSIKGGQEAMLSLIFLKLIGAMPPRLQNLIVDALNKNASSTMTNVPGPREPLLFAGEKMTNLIFFGPQSGPMGVGISVFSYSGQLTMGLNADANLIPDPDLLVSLFQSEIDNWPDAPSPG
ncbi:MAG: WS/DGAT domain-containing protein [Ketobacteraceae bacterium]|nr:WS/DGAT domain-containing protein [Ketobacteraceae bacterium]